MGKKRQVRREEDNIAVRHERRKRKRRRMTLFGRMLVFIFFAVTASLVIMFATPVFNIKSIDGIQVEGNEKIKSETVISQSGITPGQNLFKINTSQVKNSLHSLAYIDDVSVKRRLIPPAIKIKVSECKEAAYFECNGMYAIIDKNCKVLAENESIIDGLPEIIGLNLQKYFIGEKINIDESDKSDIILVCIDILEKYELLKDVNNISVEDVTNVSFVYQNRLTVKCGSSLDLEKKIQFFNAVLKNGRLADNERGTLDISKSGKTIYTPVT